MENNFYEISEIACDSLGKGDNFFNEGNYIEALNEYNTALYNFTRLFTFNNPHDRNRAYCSGKMAQCYLRLNNINDAIYNFEASIKLEPIPEFIYNLTSIYQMQNNYDKVFEYSNILLETASKDLSNNDNKYYKSEAIKFLVALANNNYKRAKQYLDNNVRK